MQRALDPLRFMIVAVSGWVIHDRDPLFTAEFLRMLADAGEKSIRLPPRSPNLNAHADRIVRSLQESCLDRKTFFGENSLPKPAPSS
jgi:putative transposase